MPKRREFNLRRHIVTALRRAWLRTPERYAVKQRVRHETKRHLFRCELCDGYFEKVTIDHIVPIVNPEEGFEDWSTFIKKLFVAASDLQSLCHDCHSEKTKEENVRRREARKAKTKEKRRRGKHERP